MADARRWISGDYRIELFAAQQEISGEDVVAMWTLERALTREEAERRVSELLLVAIDARGALAGVATAYLERNQQLRATLWHYRTFVPAAHRKSNVAATMAVAARDHLSERFVTGEDRRAIGVLFTVESPILQQHVPQAIWPQTGFVFVGEDARGAHVRVHWFPGALAPEP
jgi:hypothetical protein